MSIGPNPEALVQARAKGIDRPRLQAWLGQGLRVRIPDDDREVLVLEPERPAIAPRRALTDDVGVTEAEVRAAIYDVTRQIIRQAIREEIRTLSGRID